MQVGKAFEPIAIIGRGCHLPGAPSIEAYWNLIREDLSTVGEIPEDRLNRELHFDPTPGVDFKTYCSKACLVEPVSRERRRDLPRKWKNHPESVVRDIVSVTRDACRDAGRELEGFSGLRGGVYIGHTRGGSLSGDIAYGSYVAQAAEVLKQTCDGEATSGQIDSWRRELIESVRSEMPRRDPDGGPSLGAPVAAMAIAESLNWDGPFAAFNGACASSLQALDAAIRALQSGRIDIAVAAGASCCHSDSLILFAQARSLSSADTRPFDDAADGLIIGEGCVVLLLKRLSDAIADRDRIHGVIRGIGVASDGKGKSLWAPKKEGQILAIKRAYTSTDQMRKIQYVEAHATSTQLGDATEMEAISEAFGPLIEAGRRIPVGSVKSNVGHTLESAGLSGILKVLLCMEYGMFPAHTRIKQLSRKIPWDSVPFFVPRENAAWEADSQSQRWAAVNGFGIGGLNAHVVLQGGPVVESAGQPVQRKFARRSPSEKTTVAIIGAGCILPNALSWASFQDLVRSGRRAIRPVAPSRWVLGAESEDISVAPMASTLGGYVDDFVYDWRRHKVPPKQIAAASPLQFMILEAVDEAIRAAGILENPQHRVKTGVVVGTIFGGDFSNQLQVGLRVPDMCQRLKAIWQREGLEQGRIDRLLSNFRSQVIERMPAFFDETGSFTSSSLASRITKTFDLMGGAVAVDAAHGSSGAALAYCYDQLINSENEFMICIGAQQDMGPMKFEGWTSTGWLGTDPNSSVMSRSSEGGFPCEGAAVIVLQRLKSDGRPIRRPLGFIRGIATSRQAWGENSFQLAAERCGVDWMANSVSSVRLSPLGVTSVDQPCFVGAREATGNSRLPIATAVDQIGHLTGGSGIVECLASIATNRAKGSELAASQQTMSANSSDRDGSHSEINLNSKGELARDLVCIGSPWECIYSVMIDVVKREYD